MQAEFRAMSMHGCALLHLFSAADVNPASQPAIASYIYDVFGYLHVQDVHRKALAI